MTGFFKIFAAFVAAASLVASHGAPTPDHVLKARAAAVNENIHLLKKCEHILQKREFVEKRLAKRKAFIDRHLRLRKRNLEGPDFTANPNLHKREHALNPRQAVSCVLSPEVDTGPYYLNAQLIREDIREGQVGVPVLLDAQVIDVNTCQPIPNIYVDFWSCNSTGTYSGYAVEGTLGLTHLRGIGVTDEDGIAQITTIFPGWYSGRATHIHVATHHNAVANTNTKTITGGTVSHVGQIFFEEKFLTQIDNTAPYNRNTLRRVRNAEDIYVGQAQANGYNSVATSVLLGSNLAQGLASSFTLAVNPGIDYTNGLNSPVRQPGVPVGGGNGGTTTRPGTTPTQPSQPPAGGNLQKYSQCGGQGWNGSGSCVSGSRCVKLNDWYSQCQ